MAPNPPLVSLTGRDLQVLWLLDWTPATVELIVKASAAFEQRDDFPAAFESDSSARERMRRLEEAGLIRSWPLPLATGGRQKNYFKLAPKGYQVVHGREAALPHRSFFEPIRNSRPQHTFDLAQVIVHTITAAKCGRIQITQRRRENKVVIEAGGYVKKPDAIVQLRSSGLAFTHLYEIDEHTETMASDRQNSIDSKIRCYDAYQDLVIANWTQVGKRGRRPRFRVVFFTDTLTHARHIVERAALLAGNPRRHLVYATTYDLFLAEPNALQRPVCFDHHGQWQPLTNPTFVAHWVQPPVELAQQPVLR